MKVYGTHEFLEFHAWRK